MRKPFYLSNYELLVALGALGEFCPTKEHNDRVDLYSKITKELERRNQNGQNHHNT